MRAQRRRRREVHTVGSRRHIVVGEKRSAAEFKIRGNSSARGKVPLQIQGIETGSERGVGGLEHHKHGYGIERILESPLQKSRSVRPGENPAVTQTRIPYPGIRGAAGDGVAAAGPKLDLVPAVLNSGLGPAQRSAEQQ